jgi:signal recognition particle subunit SRP54
MFDYLSKRFAGIFDRFGKSSALTANNVQDTMQTIKDALLEADVPHNLVQVFVDDVQKEVVGQKVIKSLKPGEQFVKIVHDRLKDFLGGEAQEEFVFKTPGIVLVMGLQGSGKTTSIAKMAQLAMQQKKSARVLLASVDFYRPAAIDQLEMLAKGINASFYRSGSTDPIDAAADILAYYKKNNYDLLFLDTAGRLHIDNTMLHELREIKQFIQPSYNFLVLDAMTGQESLNVAKAFDQSIGFEYAMLSKMDSDTRGGAAFSFRYSLKKPIVFIGVGEKPTDIEYFKAERMAGRMLDMGDVVSLAEKAEAQIAKEEQDSLMASMMKGQFTLEDFARQLEMVGKLGSLGGIMKYLPGMGNLQISAEMLEQSERELKKFKAIMKSMTKKERQMPKILNSSRKERIAKGAGVTVGDVNLLLSRFEQNQQYVKLLSKFGRGQGLFK